MDTESEHKEVRRMRKILPVLLICLLLTACGQTQPTESESTAAQASSETQTRVIAAETGSDAQSTTETGSAAQSQAETIPSESELPTIRTLPGHIESDVYVRLWDGDLAPGLRAEDADAVKQIICARSWGMSYDNLSDMWIEAEGVQYAYDTQSGILTEADDRAAKLSESERVQLNAILARYLNLYDPRPVSDGIDKE